MELEAESEPEQLKIRKLQVSGRLLILGSFLLPFLLLLAPLWEEDQAAYALIQALFTLVLVGAIGLLITIRRGRRVEAWGTLGIGACTFLVTAVLASNTMWQRHDERRMAQQVVALDQEFSPKFQDLASRMEKGSLRWRPTAQTYLSPVHRARAKAEVAQFQALLAERRTMLVGYWLQTEALFNAGPRRFRDDAQAALLSSPISQTKKAIDELDKAQSEHAAKLLALLNWWDENETEVQNFGGKLWINQKEKEVEYLALFKALAESETKLAAVGTAATALQKQAAPEHNRARESIRALLD